MMNKGLEIIEAHWLFDIAPENIEVLVHPQVAVHGLVYFRDGSVIGQLGTPDMRTPISYALEWPDRMLWDPEPLDLVALGRLEFHEVDPERYPCFTLARQALAAGGIMPAVLNAANEVAVDAFLSHQIGFNAISDVVNDVMQADIVGDVKSHAAVVALDAEARKEADACVRKYALD
jgi:1-deoxy-D-xylulose-5-phosphate reductoisomerase